MYCVGLTGSIASGKTTVLHCFKRFGIDTLTADVTAKELTAKGEKAYHLIVAHFGARAVQSNGELNRSYLRQIIFSIEQERIWLETLLHPLIKQALQTRLKTVTSPYTVLEIPLLKKRSDYPYLNRVLLILSSANQQVERLIERDHCSQEEAQAILALQPSNEERQQIADDIINNNQGIDSLKRAVEQLHHLYLQLAAGNK